MKNMRIAAVIPLLLTLFLTVLPANAWPGWAAGQFEQFGPHADNLIFNVYPNPAWEYTGLDSGEIDWTDWPMTTADFTKYTTGFKAPGDPWSNYVGVAGYNERGMYQFDLNTNKTFTNLWGLPHLASYHGKINPTSDVKFRRALNYLVDKTAYAAIVAGGTATPMDTVLPPPPPWGPFGEYTGYYYAGPPFYTYNVTKAGQILDAAGWADIGGPDGTGPPDGIRNIPNWVVDEDPINTGGARQNIDTYLGGGLVFVMRTDKPQWLAWSQCFAGNMTSIGIPVLIDAKDRLPAIYQVMVFMSFHIYGGGWSFDVDPLHIRDLWYSDWYVGPGALNKNYVGYVNATFDTEADKLYFADNMATATAAAINCQRILKETTPTIPLLYPSGHKGYSTTVVSGTHAGETLGGLVNEDGVGINSWWTKLNARAEDAGGNPLQGGTLVQGLCTDIESINPISAMMYYDYEVTDTIFSSMLRQDPYNPGGFDHDIPWIADTWEVDIARWDATGIMDPTLPGYPWATKITFHLDQNQPPVFSDGVPLTAEDFAFTIYIQKKCGPDVAWRYPSFEPIDHTVVPDANTIDIYFNAQSIYFIHMIGFEYILPKHIWENCKDYGPNDIPGDFDDRPPTHPDWDPIEAVYYLDVFAEPQYLIGSGPYKFDSRLPGMWIVTKKNPTYFHSIDAWNAWHATGDIDLAKQPAGSQPANCYIVGLNDLWYIMFYWDEDTTDNPGGGTAPPKADVAQPRNYHIDLADYGQIKATYGDIW